MWQLPCWLAQRAWLRAWFGMANTTLVTCRSVLFDVKTNYFHYFIYLLFIIFIFLLFWFSVKVPGGFRVGSVGFRVIPVRFRAVPAGSGRFRLGYRRFRQVPVGSRWVPRFTYTPKQISQSFSYCELINLLRNGTIVRCLWENKKTSEKSVFREAWSPELTS